MKRVSACSIHRRWLSSSRSEVRGGSGEQGPVRQRCVGVDVLGTVSEGLPDVERDAGAVGADGPVHAIPTPRREVDGENADGGPGRDQPRDGVSWRRAGWRRRAASHLRNCERTRGAREDADPHRSAFGLGGDDDEGSLREPLSRVRTNHHPEHLPDTSRFSAHPGAVLDQQLAFVKRHVRLVVPRGSRFNRNAVIGASGAGLDRCRRVTGVPDVVLVLGPGGGGVEAGAVDDDRVETPAYRVPRRERPDGPPNAPHPIVGEPRKDSPCT